MILGLGAGWCERDYQEYGFEFGTPGSRLADLEEAIPRIQRRWSALNPAPMRDIPILIGGGGERKTLRYAARHASIWHGIGELGDLVRKNGVLDDWCATEGRDPAAIERSTPAGRPTSGSTPSEQAAPEELGPQLLAAGFTLFNVRQQGPHYDLGPLHDWIAWRDEVNAVV